MAPFSTKSGMEGKKKLQFTHSNVGEPMNTPPLNWS